MNQEATIAMLFLMLKRAGYSNREAAGILGKPWQTLYRWQIKYISGWKRTPTDAVSNWLDRSAESFKVAIETQGRLS